MAWGERLGVLFTGLSLGSILLLAALGLAITYGLMGVINMAHGEFIMIGAYATWLVQNLFRQYAPAAFDDECSSSGRITSTLPRGAVQTNSGFASRTATVTPQPDADTATSTERGHGDRVKASRQSTGHRHCARES